MRSLASACGKRRVVNARPFGDGGGALGCAVPSDGLGSAPIPSMGPGIAAIGA